MTSSKNTKRALLASVLSVMLCCAMLVGSTFAWFTDSVTSTGNKIQAGKLNIDLLVKDTWEGEYKSVKESKEAIFNYDKWEPGYTEVKYVKVETTGNLALKYTLSVTPYDEIADGELAEVIDIYYAPEEVNVSDRNLTGLTKIGTLKDVFDGAANAVISDTLIPVAKEGETADKEDYATIVLKMQESAGNEYQGLSVGGGFDLRLLATQYTYEEDSFDDQYDADASFADYVVASDEELAEVLDELCNPENPNYKGSRNVTVELASGTYTADFTVKQLPEWDGSEVISNVDTINGMDQLHVKFVGGDETIIKGIVTVNGYNWASGVLGDSLTGMSTEFENIIFDAGDQSGSEKKNINLQAAASNVTFRNCTFRDGQYIVCGGARHNAVHNINFIGCEFEESGVISGYYTNLKVVNCKGDMGTNGFINIQGAGNVLIKNSAITCQATSLKYVIRTNSGANIQAVDSTINAGDNSLMAPLITLRGSGNQLTFDDCDLTYYELVNDEKASGENSIIINGEQAYPAANP